MHPLREHKLFDPRDPSTGTRGAEVLDPSVVYRNDQWHLFLAGQAEGHGATDLFLATLDLGAALSPSGWKLKRQPDGALVRLASRAVSASWDGNGGRHCPSYVRGWDPHQNAWVERIYYAGAAENLWGPYTIGFLEWNGQQWVDQPAPVFAANEPWERGSVYEPNLIYYDGKWRLWYVAGSNAAEYIVHGYAESEDGRTGWSQHVLFAGPEMKMFDFNVMARGNRFEAVYSRVWLESSPSPPETGLWWCHCSTPAGELSQWTKPVQIMTAADRGWHTGPWKPSLAFPSDTRALVFFDGSYRTADPGPFPFAFTLGCLELEL